MPAFIGQPLFTLLIDVALVCIDIPAGIGRVEYVFEVQRGVFAGRTDLDLADELAALVRAQRQLVAK